MARHTQTQTHPNFIQLFQVNISYTTALHCYLRT